LLRSTCKAWFPSSRSTHRKPFPRQKRREKSVTQEARACGSQRHAAGVPQATRTALYFSHLRKSTSAGGMPAELRCGAVVMM